MLTSVRNRGELAEGWYDPSTLQKATESSTRTFSTTRNPGERRLSPDYGEQKRHMVSRSGSSDDEDIGPALPEYHREKLKNPYRSGPAIPSLQDLELRRGESQSRPAERFRL